LRAVAADYIADWQLITAIANISCECNTMMFMIC